ncbi:MAG: hypothetical protein BWY59_00190 [Verrucomicrobia bacterium ADurb.Bin345]|nr:MAG: hypothetical protein BWY59_00190 [Verrucomicrobia bacterium ADurb.Bin345]
MPVPVKKRFDAPVMLPGPEKTLKETCRPDEAVPTRITLFVVSCAPGFGNAIVCGRRITLSVIGTRTGLLAAPGIVKILVAQ